MHIPNGIINTIIKIYCTFSSEIATSIMKHKNSDPNAIPVIVSVSIKDIK